MQQTTCNRRHAACSGQPSRHDAPCKGQHAAFNRRHATANVQHISTTWKKQQTPCNAQRTSCNRQRATCDRQHTAGSAQRQQTTGNAQHLTYNRQRATADDMQGEACSVLPMRDATGNTRHRRILHFVCGEQRAADNQHRVRRIVLDNQRATRHRRHTRRCNMHHTTRAAARNEQTRNRPQAASNGMHWMRRTQSGRSRSSRVRNPLLVMFCVRVSCCALAVRGCLCCAVLCCDTRTRTAAHTASGSLAALDLGRRPAR
jgi:hypothetical protein